MFIFVIWVSVFLLILFLFQEKRRAMLIFLSSLYLPRSTQRSGQRSGRPGFHTGPVIGHEKKRSINVVALLLLHRVFFKTLPVRAFNK